MTTAAATASAEAREHEDARERHREWDPLEDGRRDLRPDIWWRSGDELASYSSPVLGMLRGRERGVWLARDALVVFDPASGRVDLRWPFRARQVYSVNAANPVVVGDRVFVTESYQLGGALLEVAPGGDSVEVVWRDPPVRRWLRA